LTKYFKALVLHQAKDERAKPIANLLQIGETIAVIVTFTSGCVEGNANKIVKIINT
jgi:hypothetical protein